jgi:SOS-response transcriptional repressor LexA
MNFSKRFETALKNAGKKQADLSRDLKIQSGTISTWKQRNSIGKKYIHDVAKYLNVSTDFLLGGAMETKPVFKVPVIGTASCGGTDMDHLQDDSLYCYYNGDFWHKELYCVIANGDSMSIDIEDGDEVICDPNVKPQSGDIVHYRINGESAIKVLVEDLEANIIRLKPYNPSDDFKTRTIRLDDDEAQDLKMSKVVAVNKLRFNNRVARLRLVGE